MCEVVATPVEPYEYFPGSALSSATSSASVLAGTSGVTTRAEVEMPICDTAAKSFTASYESLRCSAGICTCVVMVKRAVWPSFGVRATAAAPMVPLAPTRLSTTTGLPQPVPSSCATSRAMLSVMPPAGKGTTSVTGCEG